MTQVRFVGWDGAFLPRVARWLVQEHGSDMSGVVVALPGRRAGRRLEERLVEAVEQAARDSGAADPGTPDSGSTKGAIKGAINGAGKGTTPFVPPEITTAGRLSDRLLQLSGAVAGGLTRTLVWAQVLREQPGGALSTLLATPPVGDDLRAWFALAQELRGLHGSLAGDGLGFDAVQTALRGKGPAREWERWKLLVELQHAYRGRLAALSFEDPHESRRQAVDDGPLERDVQIVLAGVTDMGGLLRQVLERVSDNVTSLVFAPEAMSDHFDALGCVERTPWREWHVPLEKAHWEVAESPPGQAACVVDALAGLDGKVPAAQISIGVPDEQVVPSIERQLSARGIPTRSAAGMPLAQTPVHALLRATSRELGHGDFTSSAALLRHPDVEAYLSSTVPEQPPAVVCDEFARRHLPRSRQASGELAAAEQPTREVARMARLHRGLDKLMGDLAPRRRRGRGDRRPLAEWAPVLAGWLERLYGHRTWDASDIDALPESDRVLVQSLALVSDGLRELVQLPPGLSRELSIPAGQALDVLIATLGDAVLPVPAGDEAVELLGWLELPHDEASVLVLTGFNEGRVPESVRAHRFLPDGLRKQLGLSDDALRLARDMHALGALLHSGRQLTLISGRRDLHGDPLQPSRLAFHGPDEQVLERAIAWLPDDGAAAGVARDRGPTTSQRPLPMAARYEAPKALSVTAFRDYLTSPYLFYLRRVLKLDTVETEPREMDPLIFGDLAHTVLERFGLGPTKDSQDADHITLQLQELLDDELLRRFGARPLPAVVIQGQRLAHRFKTFARWQAAWRADGWRIHSVEWAPGEKGTVPFEVDGKPFGLRGRIDRIDRHDQSGEWAILDYKTSEMGAAPRRTHGPDDEGVWKDLQLPLYRRLAQPLFEQAGDDDPTVQLGYVNVCRKLRDIRFVPGQWSDEELEDAEEQARDIVRKVRAGELSALGDFPVRDRVFAAIAGRGLLGEEADADGDTADVAEATS